MKKKLMLYILTLFVLFMGTNGVYAATQVGECSYTGTKGTATVKVYNNDIIKVSSPSTVSSIDIGINGLSDMSKYVSRFTKDGVCYKHLFVDNTGFNSLDFTDDDNESFNGDKYTLSPITNALSCYYDVKAFNDEADAKYIRLKISRNANGSKIFASYMNEKKEFIGLDIEKSGLKVTALYGKDGGNIGVVTYYLDKTPAESSLTIDDSLELFRIMKDTTTCPKLSYEKWSDGTSTLVTIYPKSDYSLDLENVYATGSCKFEYSNGTVTDSNETDAGQSSNNMKVLCDKNAEIERNGKNVKFNFRIITEDDKIKWGVQINGSYIDYDLSVKQSLSLKEDDLDAHSAIKFQPDDELWDYLKGMQNGTNATCPSFIGAYYNDDFGSAGSGDLSSGTYMITMDKDKATFEFINGRTSDPGGSRHQTAVKKALEKDNPGTDVSGCAGLIGPNTLAFLNAVLNVIMIAGPIIGVLLGTYELITAMATGDDDAKKKGIKRLQNRLIASALLLLVPYIVKFILNIAGRSTSADCIDAMQNLIIIRSNLF